jgi:hypothetical protein
VLCGAIFSSPFSESLPENRNPYTKEENMLRHPAAKMIVPVLIAAIFFFGALPLRAAGPNTTVDGDVFLTSQYIWRGMVLDEELSLQPTLTVGYYDFSFNVWGQMDLTDFGEDECVYTDDCDSRAWQFTEVDFILAYSHSFGKLTVGTGIIFYLYPNWDHSEDTHEVYVSISHDDLLQPSLTVYYDFDEVDGWYINFGVGHSFEITPKFSIELSSSVGWGDSDYNKYMFGNDDSCMVDFNCGIKTPYKITENLTITPTLMFSSLLDSDNRDIVEDYDCCDETDNVYGGVSLSFSF